MYRFQLFGREDHLLRWRLLGGNNRVIAISSSEFSDLDAGLAHVELVRTVVDTAPITVDLDPTWGSWSWRLDDGTGPLAASPTRFARRIDAEIASRRFRSRAGLAVVATRTVLQLSRDRRRPARSTDPAGWTP